MFNPLAAIFSMMHTVGGARKLHKLQQNYRVISTETIERGKKHRTSEENTELKRAEQTNSPCLK